MPSNETATVKAILVGDQASDRAEAGQAVTVQLDREVDVSRGYVLTDDAKLSVTKNITTTLLWMDDDKLNIGKEYLVRLGSKKIPGRIKEIEYKIGINSGEHVRAEYIEKNEIAVCKVEFAVEGDSFKYPNYFDIIVADSGAAVLIRNCQVDDIIRLEDYEYTRLPVLDERGFALRIKGEADLDNFLYEFKNLDKKKSKEFHNKWSRFETYRRIVCTDNFWMI